jgi:two-component system, chemotaxis family, sensor kinase Cph1
MRSNKELESFAYVASHDLQEPLRMVTSFTQLLSLQYGDKLDDRAKEYINYAVEGSKRMYDLLNGLLTYSRIKTQGQDFTSVDMNWIIGKVKENLKLKLEETQASINYENLPHVNADQNQMIQLFQNLIGIVLNSTGMLP